MKKYLRKLNQKYLIVIITLSFLLPKSVLPKNIPTPETYFGFRPGTSYKLITYRMLTNYYNLISIHSDRVIYDEIGKSTEGLPFVLLKISSAENLQNLDYYKKLQSSLFDPRQSTASERVHALENGKVIISINASLHSNEIGPSQMIPNLVYRLATQNDEETLKILDNTIILILPVHNPDGLDKVIRWYEKYLGTRFEGGPMPNLYHKYAGHDINRDWFMFTQKETRLTLEHVFNQWNPQFVLDLHQMSRYSARLFVPPYIEPLDPHIPASLLNGLARLGDSLVFRMSREGKPGVVNRALFDSWTPARGFSFYTGGMRILAEIANCRIASPVTIGLRQLRPGQNYHPAKASANHPLPWQGGLWRLEDIVAYAESVVMHTLNIAAEQRKYWLSNYLSAMQWAVSQTNDPFAYAISPHQPDPATLASLIRRLQFAGVEIKQTDTPVSTEIAELDSGTYVIFPAQPRKAFIETLFGNTPYPNRVGKNNSPEPSYDATTHNLPLFLGLQIQRIEEPIPLSLVSVSSQKMKSGKVQPPGKAGHLMRYDSNQAIKLMNRLLKSGDSVFWFADSCQVRNQFYPCGSVFFQNRVADSVASCAVEYGLDLVGIDTVPVGSGYKLRLPRIGLYQSWTANIDEGWTRFVLDSYDLEYSTIHDEDIRSANLAALFDVLIFPDMDGKQIVAGNPRSHFPEQYAGGIGSFGVQNLKRYLKSGGALILLDSACELALSSLKIDAVDVVHHLSLSEFYIPGAILPVELNQQHPISFGYPSEIPILFYNSPVFQISNGKTVARFPEDGAGLSGLVHGYEQIINKTACAEVPFGAGRIILFGFRPQFRSQTEYTFKLFFNAIYYCTAEKCEFGN